MRNGLFRAQKLVSRKWVKGYYHYEPETNKHIIMSWVQGEDFGYYERHTVNGETVSRDTMIIDCDNERVYENDTLLVDDTWKGVVYYNHNHHAYWIKGEWAGQVMNHPIREHESHHIKVVQ